MYAVWPALRYCSDSWRTSLALEQHGEIRMSIAARSAVLLLVFLTAILNRTVSPGAGCGGVQVVVVSKSTVGHRSKGVVSCCIRSLRVGTSKESATPFTRSM